MHRLSTGRPASAARFGGWGMGSTVSGPKLKPRGKLRGEGRRRMLVGARKEKTARRGGRKTSSSHSRFQASGNVSVGTMKKKRETSNDEEEEPFTVVTKRLRSPRSSAAGGDLSKKRRDHHAKKGGKAEMRTQQDPPLKTPRPKPAGQKKGFSCL